MIDRRRFVGALAGSLVIARSIAEAQPAAKVYRIGFFLGATGESVASLFDALKGGLRDLGYVEGRNVIFERRYADGHMDRLPEIAAELVRLRVDVIVTGSSIHVAAARQATKTIPIVMVFTADPVQAGFVTSLARPGGNVTGLSVDASRELWSKYLAIEGDRPQALAGRSARASKDPGRIRRAQCSVAKTRYRARGRRHAEPGRPGRRVLHND